jgi:hypothetical protein
MNAGPIFLLVEVSCAVVENYSFILIFIFVVSANPIRDLEYTYVCVFENNEKIEINLCNGSRFSIFFSKHNNKYMVASFYYYFLFDFHIRVGFFLYFCSCCDEYLHNNFCKVVFSF